MTGFLTRVVDQLRARPDVDPDRLTHRVSRTAG